MMSSPVGAHGAVWPAPNLLRPSSAANCWGTSGRSAARPSSTASCPGMMNSNTMSTFSSTATAPTLVGSSGTISNKGCKSEAAAQQQSGRAKMLHRHMHAQAEEKALVQLVLARKRAEARDVEARRLLALEAMGRRHGAVPSAVTTIVAVPSRSAAAEDPRVERIQSELVSLRAQLHDPSAEDLEAQRNEAERRRSFWATRAEEARAIELEQAVAKAAAKAEQLRANASRLEAERTARAHAVEEEVKRKAAEEEARQASTARAAAEQAAAESAARKQVALQRMLRLSKAAKAFAGNRVFARESAEEQRRARRVRRVTLKLTVARATRFAGELVMALESAPPSAAPLASDQISTLRSLLAVQGQYDNPEHLLRTSMRISEERLGAEATLTRSLVSELETLERKLHHVSTARPSQNKYLAAALSRGPATDASS
jgi:hypothetical protein